MDNQKSIKTITSTELVKLGSVNVHQALPLKDLEQIDPFLLIHHAKVEVPAGTKQRYAGIGPHPHRGFSPVTFVYEGSVLHHDSEGNRAEVSEGGTQWIHSGKGIMHSERPGKDFADKGGLQEIIQFWVNTPSKFKMDDPYYLPLSSTDTPKLHLDKVTISVVAGNYEGIVGPITTHSPQTILRINADKEANFKLSIPKSFNCLIYLLDGDFEVNGEKVGAKEMVSLNTDGTEIIIQANKNTKAILLSGEPIGEPVAAYGPFVMNTQKEIMEAIQDSEQGKMGRVIEQF